MTAMGRRTFIALSAGAGVLPFVGKQAVAGETSRLAIYDSRIPVTRYPATATGRSFDIAGQDAAHWRDARRHLAAMTGDGATGVTRWSDWVNLRGLLAERGLRVASETHLGHGVFAWTMVPRA